MTTQRSLVLTLVKIFNWDESQANNLFQLQFYSLKNSTLIHSKQIKANNSANQAYFNYSLRVNYHSDENEIVIKLSHYSKMANSFKIIAEFTLNLDNLHAKKIQFFPFGKNDKVFKITVGEQKNLVPQQRELFVRNSDFIKQKEQFLMGFSNKPTSRLNGNYKGTKALSQQAKDMLQNSKSFKQINNGHKMGFVAEKKNNFQSQTDKNTSLVNQIYKRLNKSNSEKALIVKDSRNEPAKTKREKQYDKKSSKSQKHKLDLKSLEMVACQNQYYQEVEYTGERGKGFISPQQKKTEQKKLIRSQLY